jgi:two-component system response regulator VanR
MRVLIVEDEPYMAEAIRDGLRLEAIAADIAGDGRSALELLSINAYDVAVLDRDIPRPTGDEIAERIVASGSGMPILMLTAADRLDDKASGFGLGADDYLTKPFEVAELIVRVEALARRPPVARPTSGELVLDPARHSVVHGDAGVLLTPTEFRLLAAVTSRPGEVVRRRVVIAAAWPDGTRVHDNTVDSYVTRIRRKLERVGSPVQLRTVRGVGFELR